MGLRPDKTLNQRVVLRQDQKAQNDNDSSTPCFLQIDKDKETPCDHQTSHCFDYLSVDHFPSPVVADSVRQFWHKHPPPRMEHGTVDSCSVLDHLQACPAHCECQQNTRKVKVPSGYDHFLKELINTTFRLSVALLNCYNYCIKSMFMHKHDIAIDRHHIAESGLLRKLWCYDLTFATITLLAFKEQSTLLKNFLMVFLPTFLQMYHIFASGQKESNLTWWLSVVSNGVSSLAASIMIGIMCFTTLQRISIDAQIEPWAPAVIVTTWHIMYHGTSLWQCVNMVLALVTNLAYLHFVLRAPKSQEFGYTEVEMNQNFNKHSNQIRRIQS